MEKNHHNTERHLSDAYKDDLLNAIQQDPDGINKAKIIQNNTFKWGHRGCRLLNADNQFHLENTLETIQIALESGIDGIEIDLWRTADNELLVTHDSHLKINSESSPSQIHINQLHTSDLETLRSQHNINYPLLQDVLKMFQERLKNAQFCPMLNLEIKDETAISLVFETLQQNYPELIPYIVISSFKKEVFHETLKSNLSASKNQQLQFSLLLTQTLDPNDYWTWASIEEAFDTYKNSSFSYLIGLNIPHDVQVEKFKKYLNNLPKTINYISVYTQPIENQHLVLDSANNPLVLYDIYDIIKTHNQNNSSNLKLGCFIDDPKILNFTE